MILSNFANTLHSRKGKKHPGWACGPLKWSTSPTSGAVRP
jgi:hypothetical protein